MPTQLAEPERLVRRPHHGVLPIPYVTAMVDGVPDFTAHDHDRRRECAELRLCQLCGQPLAEVATLIGYPWALNRKRFGEPPMHEDCMEFAWSICPWLAAARSWREALKGTQFAARPPEMPQAMVVVWAREWEAIPDDSVGNGDVLVWIVRDFEHFETRRRGGILTST